MSRLLYAIPEISIGLILIGIIYLILQLIYIKNVLTTIIYFIFSCYLVVVWILVGMPDVLYMKLNANINVVAFRGMLGDYEQTILNVLLFIPMGMLLPITSTRFRNLRVILITGFLCSFMIEAAQLLTLRATDINDLISNTVGTAIGFIIYKAFLNHIRGLTVKDDYKNVILIVFGVVVITMFFIQPFLREAILNI